MDAGIKHLFLILFFQLHRIGQNPPLMLWTHLLYPDTLDYCNSLLACLSDNKANKVQHIQIMQPDLSSISLGIEGQHHCSEHFTAFQWRLRSNTKLLAFVFSVSLIILCLLIFLTFIYTISLGYCARLTCLYGQFLAFLLRLLINKFSLFLTPLSRIPYLCLSEKLSVSQLAKRTWRSTSLKSISVQVFAFVCVVQVVCVWEGGGGYVWSACQNQWDV